MVNTTWTLYGADHDIAIDSLLGDFATRTRGEEVALTLRLSYRGADETGGQYSAADGFQWSGPSGAQYGISSGPTASLAERYRRLVAYHDFAGAADTFVDNQQVPAYQESVPARAPISSLLVGIAPDGDIAAPGFWAVVTGGGDQTRRLGEAATVELDLFVLAEYAEYQDRAAAQSAFETPL